MDHFKALFKFINLTAIRTNIDDQKAIVMEYKGLGFDFNKKFPVEVGISGQRLLHWAASQHNNILIKLLLENGADINAVDDFNSTCLFDAIHSMSTTLLLLELGVDKTIRAKYPTFTGTASEWAKYGLSQSDNLRIHCSRCMLLKTGFCDPCQKWILETQEVIKTLESAD